MQRHLLAGRHDLRATVQRWAIARDEPGGVLRNAASGESTLTQIQLVLRNTRMT